MAFKVTTRPSLQLFATRRDALYVLTVWTLTTSSPGVISASYEDQT
jgi:hypothetical protein